MLADTTHERGVFMIRTHINYKVAEDQVEANLEAVGKFVAAVRGTGDKGYRYECFQHQQDPTRFTHVAFFDDEAAKERFFAAPHFGPFGDGLKERSVEGPNATPVRLVHSSAYEQ